ncbi:MAG: cytochrome c oxidase assembly protein [Actinobacteria bacterium]|nr:cytochrome c oxidase assembly protein [Actinomycetota bacterium]
MSWWCSSSKQTWTWTYRPYLGALVMVAGLVALGVWWARRGRLSSASFHVPDGVELTVIEGTPRGRTTAFVLGVIGLWLCIDWPLAALGAGYLAIAQMTRQIFMVMVVSPLLLFACPPEMAVRAVGWGRRLRVLRLTARPIFAVPYAAITLVAINAPAVVDPLVATPFGAFAMDLMWMTAGFVLWMPVQCPHPGVKRLTGVTAIVYLIGQSIVPVFPGFFMTWADFPIYSTYELAPRVWSGFDAVNDQQSAAAILQVGGMVLLWVQIAYRFLKWAYVQMEESTPTRKAMPGAGTAAP